MENKRAKELVRKYLGKTSTPEETAIVESWYKKLAEEKEEHPEIDTDYSELEKEIWAKLQRTNHPPSRSKWMWYSAAVFACAFLSITIYFNKPHRSTTLPLHSQNEIVAGGDRAMLILADGSKIDLGKADNGDLAEQSGVRIRKTEDGQLVYDLSAQPAIDHTFNTIVTPRGGQYQVILPDETKVWLNASSSIKFPTNFGTKERNVEISGEAYFEVSPNKLKPFKVTSAQQIIEVLGTHFNVNAYADEESTRTTLLEGMVQVSSLYSPRPESLKKAILKPGQQSSLSKSHIEITSVNKEEAVDWKNGYFQFNNEDIKSIMRKISRWYDVEVVYHENFVNQRFAGTISRFEQADKVLRMLELTGAIHFKIEGRRITVMP